jgi:hypothetical protein
MRSSRILIGGDQRRPRFAIRLKQRDPLSARARLLLFTAVGTFGVLP